MNAILMIVVVVVAVKAQDYQVSTCITRSGPSFQGRPFNLSKQEMEKYIERSQSHPSFEGRLYLVVNNRERVAIDGGTDSSPVKLIDEGKPNKLLMTRVSLTTSYHDINSLSLVWEKNEEEEITIDDTDYLLVKMFQLSPLNEMVKLFSTDPKTIIKSGEEKKISYQEIGIVDKY